MAIDDPLDQTLQQQKAEGPDVFGAALKVAALLPGSPSALVAVIDLLRSTVSRSTRLTRLEALAEAIVEAAKSHSIALTQIEKQLQSPWAQDTVAKTLRELRHTRAHAKVRRFAALIVGTAATGDDTRWQEAAEFVQDISQLGEPDALALEVLDIVLGRYAKADGTMPIDPHRYNEEATLVRDKARERGMPPEEFYARCHRLVGFGLALPVQRTEMVLPPGEMAFQLTSRGMALIRSRGHLPKGGYDVPHVLTPSRPTRPATVL